MSDAAIALLGLALSGGIAADAWSRHRSGIHWRWDWPSYALAVLATGAGLAAVAKLIPAAAFGGAYVTYYGHRGLRRFLTDDVQDAMRRGDVRSARRLSSFAAPLRSPMARRYWAVALEALAASQAGDVSVTAVLAAKWSAPVPGTCINPEYFQVLHSQAMSNAEDWEGIVAFVAGRDPALVGAGEAEEAAEACHELGRHDEALAWWRRSRELAASNCTFDVGALIGLSLMGAVEAIDEVVAFHARARQPLKPTYVQAQRSRALLVRGDREAAASELEAAIEASPPDDRAWVVIARRKFDALAARPRPGGSPEAITELRAMTSVGA